MQYKIECTEVKNTHTQTHLNSLFSCFVFVINWTSFKLYKKKKWKYFDKILPFFYFKIE